jgi:hypothetical protein
MGDLILARVSGEGFESAMYHRPPASGVVEKAWYKSDLDVDADGANGQHGKLAAYRADGRGSELLGNGGMKIARGRVVPAANWYADIVLVDKDGFPLVLPSGIIPSKTAYKFPGKDKNDPAAYLDSATVPYIAVPPIIRTGTEGIVLGCLCWVTYKGKRVIAIVGDIGPRSKNGEGSIALCEALGIDSDPRSGGLETPSVLFEIFPGQTAEIDGVTYPLLHA